MAEWDTRYDYLDVVIATFSPQRSDNLKRTARENVGWRGRWCAGWVIEGGPYSGQWAFITHEEEAPPLGWVPECDLSWVEESDDDDGV